MATVSFSDDARRMLLEADERWTQEHGLLAVNPLLDETERATEMLARDPELGTRFRRAGRHPEIRRLLLRVRWHLYYSVDESRTQVQILAVWFASRGGSPAL